VGQREGRVRLLQAAALDVPHVDFAVVARRKRQSLVRGVALQHVHVRRVAVQGVQQRTRASTPAEEEACSCQRRLVRCACSVTQRCISVTQRALSVIWEGGQKALYQIRSAWSS
jgi:hypothetical protein